MRLYLAILFRILFKISFFRQRFFGIHQKIILPFNLFKGVVRQIKFKENIYLELHIDDWIQEHIYFLGSYEDAELQYIKSVLKKGDVFVDVGANIGVHTLFASQIVGDKGQVISFEAFGNNFQNFQKNIALNKKQNIKAENLAITETDTFLEIRYNPEESNLGMASVFLTQYASTEKVKAVSLDSYLSNNSYKKINFIKLDIEGGEYDALIGMEKTLTTFYPILLIEILEDENFTLLKNKENITTYLKNIGYTMYFIDDNGKISLTEKNRERMNFVFIAAGEK